MYNPEIPSHIVVSEGEEQLSLCTTHEPMGNWIRVISFCVAVVCFTFVAMSWDLFAI